MLNMHCWWTGEPPNPVLCPPLLSTSLSLLPRRPLLLDWKLCESKDHVTDILYPQGRAQANAVDVRCGQRWSYHLTKPLTQMFSPQDVAKGPHWDGDIKRYAQTICGSSETSRELDIMLMV